MRRERSKLILAVLGSTVSNTLSDAEAARHRCVLLTGGHPDCGLKAVKTGR
jgi:hypothetical protein